MTFRLERRPLVPGDLATVRAGTGIRYRLRLFGVPFGWVSRIAETERGVRFADERPAGPYRSWYHRHRFRAAPGGVQLEDDVEYAPPLGRVADALPVRRPLDAISRYRARRIADLFPPKETTT